MDTSSDPKQVVNDLRSFCKGRDQARSDVVQRLGVEYAAHCREANRRLQQCDELLHKGLRAEAIQLADQEPVLLELVARLQFAELPAWEEVAAAYGYAPPPGLQLQSAEALNRAYADYETLKPLMKEHRRLALTRAPIESRLAVLRKIAKADPNTLAWQEDLEQYEQTWQRHLSAEIAAAAGRKEDDKVRSLIRELLTTPWHVPLGMETVAPVIVPYTDVLARGLEASQREGTVAQARQLLEEWARVAPLVDPKLSGKMLRRVEAAQEMIQRHEQRDLREMEFQSALAELEAGLRDDDTTLEDLEELYAAVAALRRGIPRHVQDAYDKRTRALARRHKHFEVIVLSVTFGGGVLLLVGFVAYLLFRK